MNSNTNPSAQELVNVGVTGIPPMRVMQLGSESRQGNDTVVTELPHVGEISGENQLPPITGEDHDVVEGGQPTYETEDLLYKIPLGEMEPALSAYGGTGGKSEPSLLAQFRTFFKCSQTKRLLGDVKNEKYRRITLETKVLPKLEQFYGNNKELLVKDLLKTDRFQEVVQQYIKREVEEILRKLEKDMAIALRQRETTARKEVLDEVEDLLKSRSTILIKSVGQATQNRKPGFLDGFDYPESDFRYEKHPTQPRPVPKALCTEDVMKLVVQEVTAAGGGSAVDKRKWSEIARNVADKLQEDSPAQKRLKLTDKGVIVKEVYLNSILLTEAQMQKIEEMVDSLGGASEVEEKGLWKEICAKLEMSNEDAPYLVRQWFKRRHGPFEGEKVRKPRRRVIRLKDGREEILNTAISPNKRSRLDGLGDPNNNNNNNPGQNSGLPPGLAMGMGMTLMAPPGNGDGMHDPGFHPHHHHTHPHHLGLSHLGSTGHHPLSQALNLHHGPPMGIPMNTAVLHHHLAMTGAPGGSGNPNGLPTHHPMAMGHPLTLGLGLPPGASHGLPALHAPGMVPQQMQHHYMNGGSNNSLSSNTSNMTSIGGGMSNNGNGHNNNNNNGMGLHSLSHGGLSNLNQNNNGGSNNSSSNLSAALASLTSTGALPPQLASQIGNL